MIHFDKTKKTKKLFTIKIYKKKTKNNLKLKSMKKIKVLAICAIAMISMTSAKAQFSTGADIVSNYVWRGVQQDVTNPSGTPNIQPYAAFTAGKFTIGSWASSSFTGTVKEFDIYATFAISSALAVTVTDYNWGFTQSYFNYDGAVGSDHLYEVAVAYTGPESLPITASINTFFAGANDVKTDGSQAYSSYLELGYVINSNAKFFAGASLMESNAVYGTSGFGVTNVGFKVSKSIEITDKFSLPVYGVVTVNPYSGNAFFVAGVTL